MTENRNAVLKVSSAVVLPESDYQIKPDYDQVSNIIVASAVPLNFS
jgi:hypothetical protein